MRFENRTPDESVNYGIEHPLKEFAWLLGGVLGGLFILSLLLGYFAGELAARLPYRYEKNLAAEFGFRSGNGQPDAQAAAIERSLNRLAARLVPHMALPDDMRITVHYDDSPVVNAYATLGGNVVIFKGLLAGMPDENTLAMVLAHEIAHARLRHPVRSLGRGVAFAIVLSAINAGMGHSVASNVLGNAGGLTLLKYSRDQESDADAEALAAVVAAYRHAGGSSEIFQVLEHAAGSEPGRVTMLSTHPLSQDRIDAVAELAKQRGWALDGPRTPLDAVLAGVHADEKPH
jgi:Putative Zn-dependent protease, contains TPR repeats